MNDELKPDEMQECPFCGSFDVGGGSGIVNCYACKFESKKYTTTVEACAAWNRRATPSVSSVEAVGKDSQIIDSFMLSALEFGKEYLSEYEVIPNSVEDLRRNALQCFFARILAGKYKVVEIW